MNGHPYTNMDLCSAEKIFQNQNDRRYSKKYVPYYSITPVIFLMKQSVRRLYSL